MIWPQNVFRQGLVQIQPKKPVSEMAAFADTVALDERQPALPVQTAVISLADDFLHVQRTVIGKVQTTVKPSKKSTFNRTDRGRVQTTVKPFKKSSGMYHYHTRKGYLSRVRPSFPRSLLKMPTATAVATEVWSDVYLTVSTASTQRLQSTSTVAMKTGGRM